MRILMAGTLVAVAMLRAAEPGSLQLRANAGYTGFVDEDMVNHLLVGASVAYYLSPRWSFEPELQFMYHNSFDKEIVFLPNFTFDFRSRGRVRPFWTGGAGWIRYMFTNRGFGDSSRNDWFISTGGGAKMFLNDRWFVAPEVRIGTELHLRVSAGIGYSWR